MTPTWVQSGVIMCCVGLFAEALGQVMTITGFVAHFSSHFAQQLSLISKGGETILHGSYDL